MITHWANDFSLILPMKTGVRWRLKEEKMKNNTETTMYCVKEIMKLPVDKKTSTVKFSDIKKLIDHLLKPLPEKEALACLQQMKAKHK